MCLVGKATSLFQTSLINLIRMPFLKPTMKKTSPLDTTQVPWDSAHHSSWQELVGCFPLTHFTMHHETPTAGLTHTPSFTRKAPADFKHALGRSQSFLPHHKHNKTNPLASLWPARALHWETCLGLTPVWVAWVNEWEMCFAKPLKFRPALTHSMATAAFLDVPPSEAPGKGGCAGPWTSWGHVCHWGTLATSRQN